MSKPSLKTQEFLRTTNEDAVPQKSTPEEVEESLRLIEDLKFFLTTAPANWQENQIIRRYYLNNDEGFVSCVFWNNLYYVTGTDIVRCCVYRMQKFGRQVVERKKFEEGIFSDLRNLKCGTDATLEMPKSEFLGFLYKNMCLKTQKKQKVFFWFSVPHDKLFADALERDLKREAAGQPSTTRCVNEPAASFTYDDQSEASLYEQLTQHMDSQRIDFSEHSTVEATISETPLTNIHANRSDNGIGGEDEDVDVGVEDDNEREEEEEEEEDVDVDEQVVRQGLTKIDLPKVLKQENIEEVPANYAPQELVVNPQNGTPGDEEYNIDTGVQPSDILKGAAEEEDDFPLDYFPVEIEYHQQDQNSVHQGKFMNPLFYEAEPDSFNVPSTAIPPASAGLYENPHFQEDSAVVQPSNRYGYQIPPPPTSAARSHFVTNGEYYAANLKDHDNRDKEKAADADTSDASNESPQEAQILLQQYNSHYGSSSQHDQFYHQGPYPNFVQYQTPMNDPQYIGSDPYLTQGFFPEDCVYDATAAFYLSDAFGGGYVPPQAMQSPQFMPRPFTPNFRSTPMSATNPYMSISPYGAKAPSSATTKSYPINPYYQPPHLQHRGNIHGYLRGFPSTQATSAPQPPQQKANSANRVHFPKRNKVTKSSPRKINIKQSSQQQFQGHERHRKTNSQSKLGEVVNASETNASAEGTHKGHTYSIPTPESNGTTENNSTGESKRVVRDDANISFQNSLSSE